MKILLAGGMGFIGKNFLLLRPKNWSVVSLDIIEDKIFQKNIKNCRFFSIDLTRESQVKRLANKIGQKFDVCLFVAANSDPALSVPKPLWDLRSSTETLINVVENFSIKKLVYFSSTAVYDSHEGLVNPTTPLEPTLPYSISHQAAEEYTRFFQKSGKVKEYLIIRFSGAYGPYEPPRKIYTKLVKSLATEGKKEFIIRGNGKNFIDAMYIQDAIEAIVKALKSTQTNLTIDCCHGDHLTINQLVQRAAKTFRVKVKIVHQGEVPEYNQFFSSPKEFEKMFDFRPKTPLEEGLKKLHQFYAQRK